MSQPPDTELSQLITWLCVAAAALGIVLTVGWSS